MDWQSMTYEELDGAYKALVMVEKEIMRLKPSDKLWLEKTIGEVGDELLRRLAEKAKVM